MTRAHPGKRGNARVPFKIKILDPPSSKLRGHQIARYDTCEQFLGVFWAWKPKKLFITTIILQSHQNWLDISIFRENWIFKIFPKISIFSSKMLIIAHNQQNGPRRGPFSRLTLIALGSLRFTQINPEKVLEKAFDLFETPVTPASGLEGFSESRRPLKAKKS